MKVFLILMLLYCYVFSFTLQEVEQRAKLHNSDILIQQNELLSTEENLKAQKLKRYGQIELFSNYTRYDSERTLKPLAPPISINIATSKDISNIGAFYTVVLFNGYNDAKDISIANIQKELQKSKITLTTNQVLYNARSLYLDILSLQKQKDAQIEHKKALDKLRANIDQEVSLGRRAQVDLFKVEADVQAVMSEISQIHTNINILKSSLGVLINYGDNFEIQDSVNFKKESIENEKNYFSKIGNLSYFKLSKLNQRKATTQYQKSQTSYYPQISFNTQYTKVYSTHGDDDKIWQASLALNWKIFDFGKTNALVQKAKIGQIKSSLELEKTKLELKQKITTAVNKIKQNEEAYLRAKKEFSLTQQTLKIETIRYEQEAIDIYNYLYAKSINEIVKAKKISAKYNLLKSYYYFEYILEESK